MKFLLFLTLCFGSAWGEPVRHLDHFESPVQAFSYGSNLLYLQNVSGAEECAHYCMNLYDGSVCSSFDYSSTSRICDLGLHHSNGELKLKPSFSYRYYKRIYDTHVVGYNRVICPRVQECDCSAYGGAYVNHWVVQGKCLDCVCKKLDSNGNHCPLKDTCNCVENEIEIVKTDLNGCDFCSCEVEELIHNENNVSYPHILIPVLRMNCGGNSFLDNRGNLWMRDSYYRDGVVLTLDKNNKTMEEQQLKRGRGVHDGSDFSYHIHVDEIGEYDVTMEMYCDDVNVTHDVWITLEDELFLQNVSCNLMSDVHVYRRVFVEDYVLDIEFEPLFNASIVNGIQLTYLQPLTNRSHVKDPCENIVSMCACNEDELLVNQTNHDGCTTCTCLPIVWRNMSCPTFASTTTTTTSGYYTTIGHTTTSFVDNVRTTQATTLETNSCMLEQAFLGVFGILFGLSGLANILMYRRIQKKNERISNLRNDQLHHRELQTGYNNPLFTNPDDL